jgi:glycosyltransferase involved in cell wall biosynthesis
MPHVLFLVVDEGLSPVFPAMVARPVGLLRQRGIDIDLTVLCPLGEFLWPSARRQWVATRKALRGGFDGRLTRLPSAPIRWRRHWDDLAIFMNWLRHAHGRGPRLVIHGRGANAATLANRARDRLPNLRVIYDMRGAQHAEFLQKHGHSDIEAAPAPIAEQAARIRDRECHAARQADAVICVSQPMADLLTRSFGIAADKVHVVWNHLPVGDYDQALARRAATRAALGLADRFVLLYCGSFLAWQPADACLDAFRSVRAHVPDAHLLVVTTHVPAIRLALRQSGFDAADVTVRTVAHADVPPWLAAADLGLIPRGLRGPPHLADRVSAPVKFAEYLAAGTPVMMSDHIGDYSELARRERLGLVLPSAPAAAERSATLAHYLADYTRQPHDWRNRCRQAAIQHLDSTLHLPRIAGIYEQLSGG